MTCLLVRCFAFCASRLLDSTLAGQQPAAYTNYQLPETTNASFWQQAYFGANYKQLQAVKAAYDPNNVFTKPQTVTAQHTW